MALTFECCGKNVFMHEYKYGNRPHCCDKKKVDMGIKDQAVAANKPIDQSAERENDKLVVWKDRSGEYRWNRKSRNGRIIATSGEGYANWSDCFDICQSLFPGTAILVDISGTVYE